MGNLKNDTNEFTKQKQIHSLREQAFGYWRGMVGGVGVGRIVREFVINIHIILYIK